MQENYPFLSAVKPLKPEYERFNKILITSQEFTIGRSLENDVVITYLAISRKHCVFKMTNENVWIIKDFSSFGIEVNKKKLKKGLTCKLCNNDVIQLDTTGDFVYKFVLHHDDDFVPRKRIKLEDPSSDILNNVKMKFEESQNFEIKHIEDKINNTKQMLTTSTILKQQLELDMSRKIERLESDFAVQIENLKGERNEVERQKVLLEEERDAQLATVKGEMQFKITDLMDQIQKHNETESELLNENTSLKEKLLKEREEFLAELHRENSSKQDLLEQLEAKIKEQEEIRLREKQELETILKKETEQLMLAKENELKKLEEQKKLREQELEKELSKIKFHLAEQMIITESEKQRLELELETKMEEMAKASEEEKSKVELLVQERAEAERKLSEAQTKSEESIKELEKHVRDREVELAALAAERIQQQAEQSSEVITSLQQQLENVRSQLHSVESEKNSLIENLCGGAGEGSSKEATLAEVGELMESELQCSICAELFVAATTLNCSHTFCKYCITVWKKKKKECPICRASIVSECKSLVLDSFIEKMVANLTDEMKKKRQAMLKDREAEVAAMAAPSTTTTAATTTHSSGRGRGRRRRTTTTTTSTTTAAAASRPPTIPIPIPTVDLTRTPAPPATMAATRATAAAAAAAATRAAQVYLLQRGANPQVLYQLPPGAAVASWAAVQVPARLAAAGAGAAPSRGPPATTTAGTDGASGAARADTGPPGAPSDSAR